MKNNMEEQAHPIAKVFTVLLAILFVITAVTSIFMVNSIKFAFDPEVYKQALSSTGVYDRLPELIGEQIVYSLNRNPCVQDPTTCTEEQLNATPAYLSSVDASEWTMILSGLVDSDWLKIQMESVIDQVLGFLSTPGQPLHLDISLVEFKTRLGGEAGYQAIVNLFNSLEPCAFGDMLNILSATVGLDDLSSVSLCRPSESVLTLGEGAIRDSLKVVADKLPDNTSILVEKAMPGFESSLAVTQRSLQLLRTLALLSPIIPLCLLLIITLLVVRSLKSFLKWWGIPIVSVAGITFICSLLFTPLIRTIVSTRVNTVGLAPEWIEAIRAAILQVTDSFRDSLNLQAGILLAVGCLMLIASALVRPRSN
jgi:hypothetical protein